MKTLYIKEMQDCCGYRINLHAQFSCTTYMYMQLPWELNLMTQSKKCRGHEYVNNGLS